jgi:hypothetical protein
MYTIEKETNVHDKMKVSVDRMMMRNEQKQRLNFIKYIEIFETL